jgi:hypothetical protein
MKTSLNSCETIEQFLLGKLKPGASMKFRIRLLTDPLLRRQLEIQKKIHDLVRLYHHRRLRVELTELHETIFADPAKEEFRNTIKNFFHGDARS